MSELEVELLRSQESVAIPHITLEVNKTIADFVKAGDLDVSKLPNQDDATFLNEVQAGLNEWKKLILSVTKLNRDVDSGTTMQEINFWTNMESAIQHIYAQRESDGVEFTFNVLKENKRFLATTGFMPDVGLADDKEKDNVYKYSNLLKDLPIKRLLSATDCKTMIPALEAIFNHLKQIRRIEYPLARSIQLMHAISRDVVSTLQSVLNSRRPMALNYEEFKNCAEGADELFKNWDTWLEQFNDELRDLKKRRTDENILNITTPYSEVEALRQRIVEVATLRKEHFELRDVISSTLTSDPIVRSSSLKAIAEAFQHLREVDVLATDAAGTDLFDAARRAYKARIDRVESDLEERIRQMLNAAKDDANEMFRVCAKFNALFVRPRIQSAIREYQEQLIATVKKDIEILQEKFKSTYLKSEAKSMSSVRDLPPVSGAIIWGRQIERQLATYMSRVEDVLGKTWHHHVEGRQLKRESDQFKDRLQPDSLFQDWLTEAKKVAQFEVDGRIFKMESYNSGNRLGVNFDRQMITLFKEVRNLNRLGLKVPYEIKIAADEAKEKYPYAVRLEEVIRTYMRTCSSVDQKPHLTALAAKHRKQVQESISQGIFLQWDTERLKKYVDTLGTEAVEFQDQVDELLRYADKADVNLGALATCNPTETDFKKILEEVQTVIDHLDKRGYSNLNQWVELLDTTAEETLVARLKSILFYWVKAQDLQLETLDDGELDLDAAIEEEKKRKEREADDDDNYDKDERKAAEERVKALDFVCKEPARHRITIRNQVLHVDPPLEYARLHLSKELQTWLGVICELPRLKCFWTQEQAGVEQKISAETFRSALGKLETIDLQRCHDKITEKIGEASSYVETWLQYQALWDMDIEMVVEQLGTDLKKWEKLLLDMKLSRSTFDNSRTSKRFGPIVIDYASVQTKVNNKYDQWHKNILNRFGQLLGGMISKLYTELGHGRKTLETFHFEFTTTKEIVDSVTLLQSLNNKAKVWKEELTKQIGGEQLLQRQRFMFPQDWIYMDRVQGEWNAFEQILNRKLQRMHKDSDKIQGKIAAEAAKLEKRITEFCGDWKNNRPTGTDLDHSEVIASLSMYEGKCNGLGEEVERMKLAREALNMPQKEEVRLIPIKEEIDSLKSVWDVLGNSWGGLEELGNTPISTCKPKEIRRGLNKLSTDIQRLPSEMRQYSGYDNLKNTVKDILGIHHAVSELVEAPLRPKHQKQVLNILKIDSIWNDATLNQLWKSDLKRHMKQIRFVLEQAQGESALEEFLADIAAKWEATKLELVDYRNKCFLIKNWDDLFETLGDYISDLSSMKHSPFYPAFESEASKWETKLNHAQAIFDVFIDVQRRWVYLEGIFTNSQDVQVQLAYQYKQFCGFDRDFVRLMREMNREDLADYWVKPERNLLEKMEGYASTLDAIQKALGEYLEKQRQQFPRFYFVGDEDLLEIIGNSKNVHKIQRHLPKMFAGIARLKISEDDTIEGMISREGEFVPYDMPIKVPEHKTIHSWLKLIESQMRDTLASMLEKALGEQSKWRKGATEVDSPAFFTWVGAYPAQVILLATQIDWSELTEDSLANKKAPTDILKRLETTLAVLADNILSPGLAKDLRAKYEQLITELVHQRDVTRVLIADKILSADDYIWLGHTRFYFNRKPPIEIQNATGDSSTKSKLIIQVSRATFYYGFEYLGVGERLVQTPLTDRCYLTMCEALHMRLGGNPYGPAGTGKTESVKALGSTLGRFVLVFNCDENFDFNAMGRIFVGLCQCGAWGCFDEFNRLEERILSAVSQQILTIQVGLQKRSNEIDLLGKPVKLNANMGMFVTMNPGYAGRSNLPDNLKQLFRGIAMIKPNGALIGQVMLYSQGFRTAEDLAGKVVLLFQLCDDQLSTQSHYDFGLRALKSVLRSSGNLKRAIILQRNNKEEVKEGDAPKEDPIAGLDASSLEGEQAILVKSISGTIVPKLVSADVPLFSTLLTAVFPSAKVTAPVEDGILAAIGTLCKSQHLVAGQEWVDKIMQFYEILTIHHGVIMVGPSGAGKTSAWSVLQAAIETAHKKKIETYVIDPKALSKDDLFGVLDNTTLEWTDGVFTHILRKIIDNMRGEAQKDHWIIFDGDVDPEWAENLNSVLDDNKLFTLPNGERLALSPNIRILFEVENLNHATPATVSRCGMVWFSDLVLSLDMLLENLYLRLKTESIETLSPTIYNRYKSVQEQCADSIQKYFMKDPETGDDETSFLHQVMEHMGKQEHIMNFTRARALMSTLALLKSGISKVIEYNDNHSDFALSQDKVQNFMEKQLVYSVLWGLSGDMSLKDRVDLGTEMTKFTKISLPRGDPLIDWEVRVDTGDWHLWADRVPAVELDSHKVCKPDVVIQTVDTVRHVDVIGSWLGDHRPLILCGPPGSGKSMTLTSVLNAMPDFELVTLNFSSTTGCDLILRTLKHYCSCEKTPKGMVMRPHTRGKWLVIFCDEINLPMNDNYETQMVITFLRQITEYGGFWRASDLSFVSLERVQIIGACNPPSDAGRVRLTDRFLRHCPLMFVDFPSIPSLRQIYGTLNRALMKTQPPLRNQADALTEAMIDVYAASQARFTPDLQPHYIYSPRELSRWVRAMYEAMNPHGSGEVQSLSIDELVRLWCHEALRLFSDRLVEQSERDWTDTKINEAAYKHFRGANLDDALQRPVLFSNWLTKQYVSVEQDALREHVLLRLQVFREEELDVKLVVFDEVLAHILRIDRVLRQPLGHLLLVGASGGGKTVLSKFVAWMSGMSTFQIKVHKHYKAADFDHDLRSVLIRSGCNAEKICFIFDESNVLDSAFLERMNALLASGEVPGLFEGADFDSLMESCRMGTAREGLIINKEDELYKWFCGEVQRNLHVVFTMNPANEDFDNRSATSPALFNRCVIDWFGEWSSTALYQVGHEFTLKLQLSDAPPGSGEDTKTGYASDDENPKPKANMGSGTERDNVVSSLVYVHESVQKAMIMLARNTNKRTYVTPRHYLDFINHYAKMSNDKRKELEEQQVHLRSGLRKLVDTQKDVAVLKEELKKKEIELQVKEKQANEKLEQMMVDKGEAESKRDASIQIAEEIKAQEGNINERKMKVEAELASAKPALEEAADAVRNIAKADLDQVSRFPNPPGPVKLALEPVILMLGEDIQDWQNIRKILRRQDPSFIKSILNYDIDLLKEPLRKKIESRYLTDPSFTFEIVYNASKACGPLVKWVSSTIEYARIKNSVQPLIDEMTGLEDKAKVLQNKAGELDKIREELSSRIEQYKTEYSKLVGEAQGIKLEMQTVLTKVERSEKLLVNLGTEQVRWNADCEGFQVQISTIVGDSLLAAAFLAYIGYFNQSYRAMLVEKWTDRLGSVNLPTKADLSLINYMSHPSERLDWISHDLPDDELCIENAIMMKRFNRYPLIIDPSGQATTFLMKQHKERKIIRTSFLDDSFLKNLESSLRFGNALLVEDVESLDPVLNSVLNKEIFRQGGRVMITLGDKEIDFSPTFVIFLSTRDPSCHFTPDLCSRVTFVNFTVTHSSLTTQCLGKLLKAERPDVDRKRSDMLKLQGEFRVRLRELEDKLLSALSGVKTNILDDESVMNSLETLKSQSAEVTQKMADSDATMAEIEEVSNKYRSFAVSCSSVYFSLENISNVHFLYQYSLPFFLGIVDKILFSQSEAVKAEQDPMARLAKLTTEVFEITFERVSRGLLHQDQIGFGVRLAQVARDDGLGQGAKPLPYSDMEFFTKGRYKTSVPLPSSLASSLNLSGPESIALGYLLALPNFAGLKDHLTNNTQIWKDFRVEPSDSEGKAEYIVPGGWEKSKDKAEKLFHHMLVCKVLRSDRLCEVSAMLVKEVFGDKFLQSTNSFNLAKVVADEGDARTPLLLVSKPGYDPSGQIDRLADELKKGDKYQAFAMGSPEGYALADRAITSAAKMGHWILLKNVHLSPSWLMSLEKRLHRLLPHNDFRIFMTMELNPKVPANLFRMSNVIIFEPPVGMKSSMVRMFNSIQPERFNKAPAERGRLYFMLTWIHSVILERLRYVPVGWTKGFEFSENDIRCAMDAVDEWVDRKAQGKMNLSPSAIPWDAIRALLNQIIYGGRIDNEFDQSRLEAFVSSLFVPEAYDLNFSLCSSWSTKDNAIKPLLSMPDTKDYAGFKAWVDAMSDVNSPELLGLPNNAENMLLSYAAEHMCYEVLQLQDTSGEAEGQEGDVETEAGDSAGQIAEKKKQKRLSFSLSGDVTADRPTWMLTLEASVKTWIKDAPDKGILAPLPTGAKQAELLLNPLYRCIQREYNSFLSTHDTLIEDLTLVAQVLSGAEPANNKVRALFLKLRKDQLPSEWVTYGNSLKSAATTIWITDFAKRVNQMSKISKVPAEKYSGEDIWLGGLQSPEAFVAATRQAVAQSHGWSLEELSLRVTVDDKSPKHEDSYTFTGMEMQGASWKNGLTIDNTQMSCKMPPVRFTWIRNAPAETSVVKVPCYSDYTRQQFLFSITLPRPKDVPEHVWSQRGISLIVWKS